MRDAFVYAYIKIWHVNVYIHNRIYKANIKMNSLFCVCIFLFF